MSKGGLTRFGLALYQARKTADLSMDSLADLVASSTSSISKLESGERNPSRVTVTKLADALNLEGIIRAEFFASALFLEYYPPQDVIAALGVFTTLQRAHDPALMNGQEDE